MLRPAINAGPNLHLFGDRL